MKLKKKTKRTWPEKFFDAAHKDLTIVANRQEEHELKEKANLASLYCDYDLVFPFQRHNFVFAGEKKGTANFICSSCGYKKEIKTWEEK